MNPDRKQCTITAPLSPLTFSTQSRPHDYLGRENHLARFHSPFGSSAEVCTQEHKFYSLRHVSAVRVCIVRGLETCSVRYVYL